MVEEDLLDLECFLAVLIANREATVNLILEDINERKGMKPSMDNNKSRLNIIQDTKWFIN